MLIQMRVRSPACQLTQVGCQLMKPCFDRIATQLFLVCFFNERRQGLLEGCCESDFCDVLRGAKSLCALQYWYVILGRITSCAQCAGIDRKSIRVTYRMKIHISGWFAGQLPDCSKHRGERYLPFEYC
jgi:hypothetical protein